MTSLLGFAIFTLFAIKLTFAAPSSDEIKHLPGWNDSLPSKQYSGYLNITETKHYHYWFVECENNPENAPIILWLNGGPGGSSLDGLFTEHGPFRLDTTSKPSTLQYFNYTWSKVANVIYLESPIGVGFTYSDSPDEYSNNDDKTASDNMKSVEKLFEIFPEYGNNSLYIAGESYGGIYVPTLAEAILHATLNETYEGAPLKGIAVGNGCIGTQVGFLSEARKAFYMQFIVENTAFISQSLRKKINENCDWDNPTNISNACKNLEMDIRNQTREYNGLNIYNIYGDKKSPLPDWGNIQLEDYINQENFIDAIHVKGDIRWEICNTTTFANYNRTRPNLPRDTYPLLNDYLSVLIYNGDWDRIIPYTDNEWWTRNMGYPISHDWHPWLYQNGNQLGGYATTYVTKYNFTFITVRGGAHAVPSTAPAKAFEMISRFLSGSPF